MALLYFGNLLISTVTFGNLKYGNLKSDIMYCERLRFGCLSSVVFVDSDQKCPPKQGVSVLPLIVLVSKTRSEH